MRIVYALIAAVLAGAVIAIVGRLAWIAATDNRPPPGTFGIDAAPTKHRIKQLAAMLDAAEQRGDTQALTALLDDATAALRLLNDVPGIDQLPMHNCRLAAVHLANGVIALMDGGHWASRRQYNAALDAC